MERKYLLRAKSSLVEALARLDPCSGAWSSKPVIR